jgi:cyclopropane fatty-acyl-phospholipid synthase-like methyltransferase
MNCRFCNSRLHYIFADLGKTPLANSYVQKNKFVKKEVIFPLKSYVCSKCFLVQLEKFEEPSTIFKNYAYMSSFSNSWLEHIENFCDEVYENFKLTQNSKVVEIASNDGYLLKNFQKKEVSILGIEPAENVAKIARKKKIPTITKFFGHKTSKEIVEKYGQSDMIIAFNVLPHVPNLKDFIKGIKNLLKKEGIVVIQFSAYLDQMIQHTGFDAIYHEHFSYFSLTSLKKIFDQFGLIIFDVEEHDVHGGSLRLFIKHKKNSNLLISKNIKKKIAKEKKHELNKIQTYTKFQNQIIQTKIDIWKFFIKVKNENKSIVGYGAPAKATTMLNYCGIKKDFLEYTVDINPNKQNHFLPGTNIPIFAPKKIFQTKPDYVLILAWNLKNEIINQLKDVKKWNCKFVVFTPKVRIIN